MKILLLVLAIAIIPISETNAQDKEFTKVKRGEHLFMDITKEVLTVHLNANDPFDDFELRKKHKFSIKENNLNFFVKWYNPLKYNIKIQDSSYIDPRDKAIQEYVLRLLGQFNIQEEKSNDDSFKGISDNPCSKLDFQFNNNILFTMLNYSKVLTESDSKFKTDNLCNFFKRIKKYEDLELKKSNDDLKAAIKELFEITSISELKDSLSAKEDLVKTVSGNYIDALVQNKSLEEISTEKLSQDIGFDTYLKRNLKDYLERQKKLSEENKALSEKLAAYLGILKNSISKLVEESSYLKEKGLFVTNGKEVVVAMKIIKNKIGDDGASLEEESFTSHQMIINRYDIIRPTVSSGLFFANTTLKGFGVATNDADQLVVSEDDINKNDVVTGLFLNLNFDINSRYLSPLLQIGIDPTKKRPFLLLGGGISIPSSNFSITGGPIWTWDAELEEFSAGDIIESTTDLDNDINYNFDLSPKGWYLGLQYSF